MSTDSTHLFLPVVVVVVNANVLGMLLACTPPTLDSAVTVKLYSELGRRPVTLDDSSGEGEVETILPSVLRVAVTVYNVDADGGEAGETGSLQERCAQVAPVETTTTSRGSEGGPSDDRS